MRDTKKMMNVTMLVAISILFHLIESMITVPVPIPGFKFGLANIVGLTALYLYDWKTMIQVNVFRVVLASILRGTLFGTGFWLSACGVMLSCIAVIIFKKLTPMSIYGVSVGSSVFHVIGQMIAVTIIYQQFLMGALLPILTLMAIPTGLAVAYIARQVIQRIGKEITM